MACTASARLRQNALNFAISWSFLPYSCGTWGPDCGFTNLRSCVWCHLKKWVECDNASIWKKKKKDKHAIYRWDIHKQDKLWVPIHNSHIAFWKTHKWTINVPFGKAEPEAFLKFNTKAERGYISPRIGLAELDIMENEKMRQWQHINLITLSSFPLFWEGFV